MLIEASAGLYADVKTHIYSVRIVAQTEKEARHLAASVKRGDAERLCVGEEKQ